GHGGSVGGRLGRRAVRRAAASDHSGPGRGLLPARPRARRRHHRGGAMSDLNKAAVVVVFAAFAGCSWFGWGRGDGGSPVSETFAKQSDIKAQESRTLSGLATLENSLHDYIKG